MTFSSEINDSFKLARAFSPRLPAPTKMNSNTIGTIIIPTQRGNTRMEHTATKNTVAAMPNMKGLQIIGVGFRTVGFLYAMRHGPAEVFRLLRPEPSDPP